nr:peroxidase 60-like [Ipomoea trifida]
MSKATAAFTVVVAGLVFAALSGHCHGQLQAGFYTGKCGYNDVEGIVKGIVKSWYKNDTTITAALLRMQFHDCFVKGCDASILLDGNDTEKTAIPNLSVRGYDLIDAIKAALEKACPQVVSCADIIVMATRDAVSLSGGTPYMVQTGRRDGRVSLASNVDLPSPKISVVDSVTAFAKKGLNTVDMVYLLGGHTVGVAHCSVFKDRLYNFDNTGRPDPSMNLGLLFFLRLKCPKDSTFDNTANLDQSTPARVDNYYYQQLLLRNGVLQFDQQMALDSLTRDTVKALAWRTDFGAKFGAAMVKLGAVDVLTGSYGEIRKSCRLVNT